MQIVNDEIKRKAIGYELLVLESTCYVLYRGRFLDLWEARSMISSIVYSDIYENAFTRTNEVSCRINEVELTDDEIIALTPPPKTQKSKR